MKDSSSYEIVQKQGHAASFLELKASTERRIQTGELFSPSQSFHYWPHANPLHPSSSLFPASNEIALNDSPCPSNGLLWTH